MRKPPRSGHKGGAHDCATCNHPDREAIETALAARTPSLKVLSGIYGMDGSSLSRHRTHHMIGRVVAIHSLPADATQLAHMEAQAARLEVLVSEAERRGHSEQVVALFRELRITREKIAAGRGELNGPPATTIDIQKSKEWAAIRAVIWEELAPHPALRVAIGKRLLALDAKEKT